MTFTANVPVSGQSLGNSRPLINTNFSQINGIIDVDHYTFQKGPDGQHKWVTLNPTTAVVNTGGGTCRLFPKTITDKDSIQRTWPFVRACHTDGSNQIDLQMAGYQDLDATNGQTFLANGLIMQWGTATQADGTSVSFKRSFTGNPYSLQLTILQNTSNRFTLYAQSVSSTGFVVTCRDSGGSGTTLTFTYLAIGAV